MKGGGGEGGGEIEFVDCKYNALHEIDKFAAWPSWFYANNVGRTPNW